LHIDRSAAVERVPLGDGRSWLDLAPGFCRDASALLHDLIAATPWQRGEVWRYDKFVEENRLGAFVRTPQMTAPLRQVAMHLDATYRVRFPSATLVYYRNGRDFQGMHSDRGLTWLDNTLVGGVVLGVRRPFVLRPRRDVNDPEARRDASEDVVVTPGEGDLFMMGGRAQRDWLHAVPSCDTELPRISVIWRWSSKSGEPDTAPSYFDGRHYSDKPGRSGYRYRRANG
jgi:alkylated DNA repair dioxygenase AlkB